MSITGLGFPCTLQTRPGPLFYLTIILDVASGIFAWFDWSLFVGIFGGMMRDQIVIRAGLTLYDLRESPRTSASSSLAEDSFRR